MMYPRASLHRASLPPSSRFAGGSFFVSPSAFAASTAPEYFDSDARLSSMDSDSSSQTMTVSVMGACVGRGATFVAGGWSEGGGTPGGGIIPGIPGIIPGIPGIIP